MRLTAAALLVLLGACASAPPLPHEAPPGAAASAAERAAAQAAKMIGRPYRFGGATPAGFDCSGLVQYSYREAGVALPHNTDQQRLISHPVERAALRAGDLLFFDLEGKKNSHVGIYLGRGAFVHAPTTGKSVRSDRLDAPFWARHLSETRRLAF